MLDHILEALNKDGMPNKVSSYMGERIREAREAKGLSQTQLAEQIYKRRASISEMESGKMYADIASLLLMSRALEKPLTYFIHPIARNYPAYSDLTEDEETLLFYFRDIKDFDQRHLAISQIKAIAELFRQKEDSG